MSFLWSGSFELTSSIKGLSTRSCLDVGTNNHLRSSWHHWLACVRQTLCFHAEHAAGFMWSGISIRSASCAARWTCDVPGKLAAFLHKIFSAAAEISKSISGSTCARSQWLRLQRSHSSARGGLKSRKEDRRQESRIRSKDERCRPTGRLQLSRHRESSFAHGNATVTKCFLRKKKCQQDPKVPKSSKLMWVIAICLSLFYPEPMLSILEPFQAFQKTALESKSNRPQREFLRSTLIKDLGTTL